MAKYNAHGTQLQVSDGGGTPVFTAVAQVESFQGPSMQRNSQPAPTHDTASNAAIPKIPDALFDGGVIAFTILYDPAGTTHKNASSGLLALFKNGTVRDIKFVFPDLAATTWTLTGFFSKFAPKGMDANSGLLRADVEYTGTATPTLV